MTLPTAQGMVSRGGRWAASSFILEVDVKGILLVALVLLAGLQYRLWVGDGSLAELWRLRQAVQSQQAENARLTERNQRLAAEVSDLKHGVEALEARARHELGLIGENETFFQYISESPD